METGTANPRPSDTDALTALVVDCPELGELEDRLGGFNLFETLGIASAELRHSHTLAWLLDPAQSHGLDDLFLQNWLMRVVHESGSETAEPPSPVEMDTWNLAAVEVRREWRQIDVLLILTLEGGEQWVVCIENKVATTQHSDQLRRYRNTVVAEFPHSSRHLFIFLTRDEEIPADDAYVEASYAQVAGALRDALQRRRGSIGDEPRLLMENYLRLIEERFMNDSDIARLARSIYRKHRRAIDVILEHLPDRREAICENLQSQAREDERFVPLSSTKASFRFMPVEWDLPKNRAMGAWGAGTACVIFEVGLVVEGTILMRMIAGRPPVTWYHRFFEMAQEAPFVQSRRRRPIRDSAVWFIIESFKLGKPLGFEADASPEDEAQRLWKKITSILAEPDVQARIATVAEVLQNLPDSDE